MTCVHVTQTWTFFTIHQETPSRSAPPDQPPVIFAAPLVMPALAFGLNAAKSPHGVSKTSQKRKAIFDEDDETESATSVPYGSTQPPRRLKTLDGDDGSRQGPRKSPKLSQTGPAISTGGEKYTNLSALRSAKLHDEQASKLDASVYDYDAVYDTFHAPKQTKTSNNENGEARPKYMTSLLQSAEVRKRDQLRAREKLLQREREAEGDEYADKEKFVTAAYKKQQEEVKRMEEEEKKREEEEEERRRRGGGMTAFHQRMLEKDEERMQQIKQAEEEAAKRKEREGADGAAGGVGVEESIDEAGEKSEARLAAELNEKGARIVVNDEGEVVDKRQLLSAGLNVAPQKSRVDNQQAARKHDGSRAQEHPRFSKALDARQAQRERQSRMLERQIEEMTERQRQAEREDEKERQEKTQSKITETDKMSARERYLQRKREREEEARKAKEAKGTGG